MSDDSSTKNFIPRKIAEYREKEYWERRYKDDESNYEWLLSYFALKPILSSLIRPSDRILILGCGNSRLSEELYMEGYRNIVNIDYSEQVIRSMMQRNGHLPLMEWHVMDMRELLFKDESFDVVLDKASLDAVWTDGGSVWDPSKQVRSDVDKTIRGILRVLKKGGKFISISLGQPHFRLPLLKCDEWELKAEAIVDTLYFLYTATKP